MILGYLVILVLAGCLGIWSARRAQALDVYLENARHRDRLRLDAEERKLVDCQHAVRRIAIAALAKVDALELATMPAQPWGGGCDL